MRVYVINIDNEPLMPCSPRIARRLLRASKAKVKRRTPFTIKLNQPTSHYVQPVTAGMDIGSKTIGTAAIASKRVIYQAETVIRNDVSKKMTQRRMYRRTRRGRLRYRAPRFLNRTSSGLPPSLRSKVDSHLRERRQMEQILPISKWVVETTKFDIARISNNNFLVDNYQKGDQLGYYNVKAFVLDRDNYKCKSRQKCKHSDKLHVHHIRYRSQGGTNAPANLVTLCESCHKALHAGMFTIDSAPSRTRHAMHTNYIANNLKKLVPLQETFGYITKYVREQILHLPKTHYNDAVAIASGSNRIKSSDYVLLKRHVSSGDYRQTKGPHSNIRIPTGKLFGLRKFDLIQTPKGTGFIKGKRSTGWFVIGDIFSQLIDEVSVKKNCKRLQARSTTLIYQGIIHAM